MRKPARGASRQRLVRSFRRCRRCHPCRRAWTYFQRLADWRSQIAFSIAANRWALSETGPRRGGDRCPQRRWHRRFSQGHALRCDRWRHRARHRFSAGGLASEHGAAPGRSVLQRCGRQRPWRSLCRSSPVSRGKIRHSICSPSASNRRWRLERRASPRPRNERIEAART